MQRIAVKYAGILPNRPLGPGLRASLVRFAGGVVVGDGVAMLMLALGAVTFPATAQLSAQTVAPWQARSSGDTNRSGVRASVRADAPTLSFTPRNQRQETAFAVQSVPRLWILVSDFGIGCRSQEEAWERSAERGRRTQVKDRCVYTPKSNTKKRKASS
eukprot:2385068-Rhodomonas_salina.2